MKRVLRLTAEWCGPCKGYAPIFEAVEDAGVEGVEFMTINIDNDTTGAAAEYGIKSVPCTIVDNGGDIKRHIGVMSEVQLINFIN